MSAFIRSLKLLLLRIKGERTGLNVLDMHGVVYKCIYRIIVYGDGKARID